jgi:hypothetical protein
MAGFAFSRRLRQAAMRRGTRGPKVRRSRTRLGALVGDLSRELDRCGFAWRGRLSVSAPSAVLSARRYACRSCPRPSCERVSGEALELANKTLQAPPVEVRRRPAWSSVDGASARMISHNNATMGQSPGFNSYLMVGQSICGATYRRTHHNARRGPRSLLDQAIRRSCRSNRALSYMV